MSKMETPHYPGNPRTKEMPAGLGAMRADCTVAHIPADGKPGYATGCLLQVYDGSAGGAFYINEGTKTSCDFNPVLTTGSLNATPAEIDRAADVSTRIALVTASTLSVAASTHDGKVIVLDRAAGIAITVAQASITGGERFRFIVKTTFTGAASISLSGDIMIGHALMGNNSDNTVVDWQAVAGSNINTIDLLGTANSTGGMAGQEIELIGLGTGLWFVSMRGDAAGTEATPFASV